MDIITKMVIRAVVSGLRESGRIDAVDCAAIVRAIDKAGDDAFRVLGNDPGAIIDLFAADIARDCFGPGHTITLAAEEKTRTDPHRLP